MLDSSLRGCSHAFILAKVTIALPETRVGSTARVIFAPFSYCISKMNNTQVDNAKYVDVVMTVYH